MMVVVTANGQITKEAEVISSPYSRAIKTCKLPRSWHEADEAYISDPPPGPAHEWDWFHNEKRGKKGRKEEEGKEKAETAVR